MRRQQPTDLDVTAIVSNGEVTKTGEGTCVGRQQYLHRADHGQYGTLVAAHANALGTTDAGTTVPGVALGTLIVAGVTVPEAISIARAGVSTPARCRARGRRKCKARSP